MKDSIFSILWDRDSGLNNGLFDYEERWFKTNKVFIYLLRRV